MSVIVKGLKIMWADSGHRFIEVDINLAASRGSGVWLIDGSGADEGPFRLIVGCPTEHDAARAYAMHRKAYGHVPPSVFRVFPLVDLEPIALTGIIDEDKDDTWSAFQDAWIEVRL